MPLPDLGTGVIAFALGVISFLISLAILTRRKVRPKLEEVAPPAADVAPVAEAARENAAEAAQADDRALEDAVNDEHPATALAHLVNADRRRKE